jgi:hypothetical protein
MELTGFDWGMDEWRKVNGIILTKINSHKEIFVDKYL